MLKKINKAEALKVLTEGGWVSEGQKLGSCYYRMDDEEIIHKYSPKGYKIGGKREFEMKRVFFKED